MTVPNANRAIIAADKLTAYLLNMSHKRGAAKARLLLSLGYRSDAAHVLESDLRAQHHRAAKGGARRASSVVMPGLDPGIHSVAVVLVSPTEEWIAGSSPAMTTNLRGYLRL